MVSDSELNKFNGHSRRNPHIQHSNSFKRSTFMFKLRTHFRSYCNHTSIHGFKYFGQKRTIVEKCWWILIFIGIIGCCCFTIGLIYNKWQKSPLIVSLTTIDTPIYLVPFPAVTICPTIKFSKNCINFSNLLKKAMDDDVNTKLSLEQQKILSYMLPLCKIGLLMDEDDLENLELQNDVNESTISHDIFEIFRNCSPFLGALCNSAKFMGEEIDFDENFRPYLTEDGLCFTFNMLSREDMFRDEVYFHPGFNASGPKSYWIPQQGYSIKAGIETFPRRALMSGVVNSLEIRLFHQKKDIDYMCTGAEQGYKVILHHPTRIPTLEYTMVQFSKASTVSVKPVMMSTSDVVKTYAPHKRDCYFNEEKALQFFKIYSQRSCLFECLTNYTLKKCGCVAFHMPRLISTPICGIAKLHCVNSAKRNYNLNKLKSKLNDFRKSQVSRKTQQLVQDYETTPDILLDSEYYESSSPVSDEENEKTTEMPRQKRDIIDGPTENLRDGSAVCDCYRTCNELTYTGTATAMEYDWREESILGKFMNSTAYDFTLITVFLDTNTIFTTERNELYGPTDFLSNFGGLIALFTGFSILSLMEILYFCTLRIFGNKQLLGKWYGDNEE